MVQANSANITDINFDLSLSVTETDGKEGKTGIMSSIRWYIFELKYNIILVHSILLPLSLSPVTN